MASKQIFLIDNYDSFTHNLAHYLEEQNVSLVIRRNDDFKIIDLEAFDAIVISPGPGLPEGSGQTLQVIKTFSGLKPILGVCLGLQAIYESFGGRLFNLPIVHHGVSSEVIILDKQDPIYQGIHSNFFGGRYHSWVCDPATLPSELIITAADMDGTIMSCRHRKHPTFGIQYHPESILTPEGKKIIGNFVGLIEL